MEREVEKVVIVNHKIIPKRFANKIYTKQWLSENTSFAYPKNLIELDLFDISIAKLEELPIGEYVWKPCFGRKGWGVALLEKTADGYRIFPSNTVMSLQDTIEELIRIKRLTISEAREARDHRKWFAEEWIKPHERLRPFTDDMRCPPIIRICGRSKVHFVVISPVYFKEVGISSFGWGHRKYLWLDFNGVVKRTEEMDLSKADKKTLVSVVERHSETALYGQKIEGVKEIIDQVNYEIALKLKLVHNKCWSVDGVFDKDNKFVIIEINSAIGTPFLGVTWKK
jgi:hypothetical protein